jgi:hypothetical protein
MRIGGGTSSLNRVLESIEKLDIDNQRVYSETMKRLSFDNHISGRSEI